MFSIAKILKLELFFLFLLTSLSFVDFYYQNELPDNFMEISSRTAQLDSLVYYAISLVTFVGHFTGPWIFLPFMLYSFFYSFKFSKREKFFDTINVFTLCLGCLLLGFALFPTFIGQGISYLLRSWFNPYLALLAGFLSLALFCAGTFRVSLKKVVTSPFVFMGKLPEKMRQIYYFDFKGKLIKQLSFSIFSRKKSAVVQKEEITEKSKPEIKKDKAPFNYHQFIATLISGPVKKKALLSKPKDNYFEEIIEKIESKLAEFKIEGSIINILKGPVINTFELELGSGVKVSRILNHETDLSLALSGIPIRIIYPILGKTTVGIEVPREPRELIGLHEIWKSDDFASSRLKLPIVMGKNAFGKNFVVDLAEMPHMLVAGVTGVGKSIFLNSLLLSLLVKKSPQQMRLILIDPKQLELAIYQALPHLMVPVVTDRREAPAALAWACQEMERRYFILKELGAKNIEGFNDKVGPKEKLPYLVIIIDEFADFIVSNKFRAGIEEHISRLAAKARAAGIHLVVATQRPSVDVITGVVKSNFPCRVAFKVTSQQDSRTILTTMGAEKLLGKGDGLFRNGIKNVRFHSAYMSEEEVEAINKKLGRMPQEFNQNALKFLESKRETETSKEEQPAISAGKNILMNKNKKSDEELFKEALQIIVDHRTISTSLLQRRLRIGYNRAALLIEQMELQGIIGEDKKILSVSGKELTPR